MTQDYIPWKISCLADLLDNKAVAYLARNIQLVYGEFKTQDFLTKCEQAPQNLALMARAHFIAKQLHQFLPNHYSDAIEILTNTLIDCDEASEEFGLDKFFYLPHSFFIAEYGRDARFNSGHDPFDISIAAQYQLTQRFSAEFCIRPFLIEQQ